MGDRISFQFVNGNDKSVVFFSHWAGEGIFDMLKDFNKDLHKHIKSGSGMSYPLTRMEPETVMLNFIAWLGRHEGDFTDGDFYLGVNPDDGDNSDNGHWFAMLNATGLDKMVAEDRDKLAHVFPWEV